MNRILWISVCVLVSFLGLNTLYRIFSDFLWSLATVITVENTRAEVVRELTYHEKATLAESKYGLKPGLLTKIIQCESSFRPYVYGDNFRAFSLLQFHEPTFELFKRLSGMTTLDYRSPDDQIELGAWAFSRGYSSHWTCSRKI